MTTCDSYKDSLDALSEVSEHSVVMFHNQRQDHHSLKIASHPLLLRNELKRALRFNQSAMHGTATPWQDVRNNAYDGNEV